MAMTFSTGTIPSVFSAAAAVTTQAITIPADAKVLFVGVNGDAASNGGAAAPTYCRLGSSEMTLAGTAPASANGQYLWLYRLDNPVPGSYNITCVHPTVQIILQSVCVAGTIPYDLVIGAGTAANTATPSSTASSTAVGGKVIHFAGFNNVMIADVTETGTKTIIAKSNGADASFGVFGAYVQDSAAGSTTATWTTSTANRFSAITIYLQEKLRYVTSFNNSLAVTPGQKSIAVTAGGFTALPAVTATYTGGTLNCTNVTGTSTSFTFDIDSRANGLAYPKVGDNITFTLTNGAESISYVSTLGLTAVETSVTFALASVANERNLGYHLAMDGYTVDGGEFIYKPYSNLAINAGGLVSVKKAGVINGWFRPSTGQGAGNVYSYSFNIPATNNYFLSLTTRTELPYTLANSWSNVLSLDTYAPVPSGATHVLIETFMPSNTTSCTYGFQNGEDYTNYVYSSVTRISRYDWISLNTAKTLKLFCNSLGNMKFYVRAYTNYIKNLPTSVDLSSQVTSSNQTTVYCNSLPADAAGGAAIIINYTKKLR